jgi:hypothetical protein
MGRGVGCKRGRDAPNLKFTSSLQPPHEGASARWLREGRPGRPSGSSGIHALSRGWRRHAAPAMVRAAAPTRWAKWLLVPLLLPASGAGGVGGGGE